MRLLLAALLLLAGCQPDEPANIEIAKSEGVVANLEGQLPASNAATGGPDTPLSSDDPPSAAPPAVRNGDCPIVRSGDWQAHVDAMPGPNDNPRLIVSGTVTVPSGGYKLALRMGQVAESYPVQVTVYLDVVPPKGPATQALETREVRGSWRSEERVGSVTIRCGSRVLAGLSNVGTAH